MIAHKFGLGKIFLKKSLFDTQKLQLRNLDFAV